MPDSSPPVIDRNVVATLAKLGGEQMVIDLIDRFRGVIAERMDPLRAAALSADAGEVEQIAHALRSSAATLGAAPLAARFQALEELAAGGEADGLGGALGHVSAELPLAMAALDDIAGEMRAVVSRRPTI